jgi:hypothetical protein
MRREQIRLTSRSKKLIRNGTVVVLVKSTLPDRGGKIFIQGEKNMPNNKDQQKSDSMGSMDKSSDRELGTQGKKSSKMDDDNMNTSGGQKGNFSDKDRGSEKQWSPGSSGSTDQ